MHTYAKIMRLIRLQSRMEARAWRLLTKARGLGSTHHVYFKRALHIHDVIAATVLRLQVDVNTLNTALRDREES